MENETEQNKTEEPTPYKLKRAREKGIVARGIDLGFFSCLLGFSLFCLIAGDALVGRLAEMMRLTLSAAPGLAHDPPRATTLLVEVWGPSLRTMALAGATIMLGVAVFEIVQIRGIVFSGHPLKPDFNRLNPAKGLKRVFSARMLKETLKSIVKLVVYAVAAYLVIRDAFDARALSLTNASALTEALRAGGFQLLFAFTALALAFAALDQVIARADFQKQMRMSRSELVREHKEREGEPRLKQKRKQMHADFTRQARALGDLRGSDLLIVNPQHYAVALKYDASAMTAPVVVAKGRNHFALLLKRRAAACSLAIFERPALARTLYNKCHKGSEAPPETFRDIADLYVALRASTQTQSSVHASA
jgi:flagellar biosynthesis protein FlhB